MIYVSTKFEVATLYGLGEDTIARNMMDGQTEQLWYKVNIPYFSKEKADIITQFAELEKTF